MNKKNGTGLRYIPISDFNLIPPYLFEQLKNDWDLRMIYGPLGEKVSKDPFQVLGVFADKSKVVKGFLWGSVNPLNKNLFVHALSVDREYQGKGILNEATNILHKIKSNVGVGKIVGQTKKPKAFEKNGWKRSEYIILEDE